MHLQALTTPAKLAEEPETLLADIPSGCEDAIMTAPVMEKAVFRKPDLPGNKKPQTADMVVPKKGPVKLVRFVVGPRQKEWELDESLLAEKSPSLKGIIESTERVLKIKTVSLPTDDPTYFAKFVSYCTINALQCSFCGKYDENSDMTRAEFEVLHELSWCKFFLLAEKYGAAELADKIVRRLFLDCLVVRRNTNSELFISKHTVDFIHKETDESSLLRNYMAAEVAYYSLSALPHESQMGRLAEMHGGDEVLERQFLSAIHQHIGVSHTCAYGEGLGWRVPNHCYYFELDIRQNLQVPKNPAQCGYPFMSAAQLYF